MNRRQLLASTIAAAVAPALPVEAAEPSPFPPLYWRFTLSNNRRVTRCGFPFDKAALSALRCGDQIVKIERMGPDGCGWQEMTCFAPGTVTPEHIAKMVHDQRAFAAKILK